MVRSRLCGQRVPGSKPDSTEDTTYIGPAARQIILRGQTPLLVWCGSLERRRHLRRHPRHLTAVQYYEHVTNIQCPDFSTPGSPGTVQAVLFRALSYNRTTYSPLQLGCKGHQSPKIPSAIPKQLQQHALFSNVEEDKISLHDLRSSLTICNIQRKLIDSQSNQPDFPLRFHFITLVKRRQRHSTGLYGKSAQSFCFLEAKIEPQLNSIPVEDCEALL
ncbi:hypothetical protein AVEN_29926-1 [Araneus ventricosus]|uniref:Uncharacterized protein n=1 Tax=Araneus ventricosus TaxID=182803 RepID=A0A4Y2QID0_ARAVE|nr:hypothetical protein AVEN_29926-1 [Araneus ventricosus]